MLQMLHRRRVYAMANFTTFLKSKMDPRVDLGSMVLDWTFTADSNIGYLVHSDNSEFVVFSTATTVYALSAVSGLLHWTFPTTQPAVELFSTRASVVFGQPEGTVTVLSTATGLATALVLVLYFFSAAHFPCRRWWQPHTVSLVLTQVWIMFLFPRLYFVD